MFTKYAICQRLIFACALLILPFITFAQAGDIIITEIYADPNSKGLQPGEPVYPTASGAEFIEIYNRSGQSVSLAGYQLSGKNIPPIEIGPLQYHILCPAAYQIEYEKYGAAAGLSSWNGLSNGGERVYLTNSSGLLVDEVAYASSWHAENKDRGGWSLERINPILMCSGQENWTSSKDVTGATPGRVNSVNNDTPDSTPPALINIQWLQPELLTMFFSESVDISSAKLNANPDLTAILAEYGNYITATFSPLPEYKKEYQFTLSGVKDCEGNVLPDASFVLTLDGDPPVLSRVAVISERSLKLYFDEPLADPYSGGLKTGWDCGWSIERFLWDPSIPGVLVVENTMPFTEGTSCTLAITGASDLSSNVAAEITYPFTYLPVVDTAFTSAPGVVKVVFSKLPANHSEVTNYVLQEAGQHPFIVLKDQDQPGLVSLVFSPVPAPDQLYQLTMNGMVDDIGNELITPAQEVTWDTQSPKVAFVQWQSPDSIRVGFNEPVQEDYALLPGHYEISSGQSPCSVQLLSDREVLLTYCPVLDQEITYRLKVHSIADLYGNVMTRAKSTDLFFDSKPPEVTEVKVTAPSVLTVTLSEKIQEDESTLQSLVRLDDGMLPYRVIKYSREVDSLVAYFSEALPMNSLTLQVGELSDNSGNISLPTTFVIDNSRTFLTHYRIETDTSLLLHFNHTLPATSLNGSEAHINSQITELVVADSAALRVRMPVRLQQEVVYSCSFTAPWLQDELSIDFSYQKGVKEVQIAGSNMLRLHWVEAVHEISASGFLLDGEEPVLTYPDPSDAAISYLLFNKAFIENTDLEVLAGPAISSAGKYLSGSRNLVHYDKTAPYVSGVQAISEKEISLKFSEPVDQLTTASLLRYNFNGAYPEVVEMTGVEAVRLQFYKPTESNSEAWLSVNGIKDLAGNEMADTLITFTFQPPHKLIEGELVITEVLPDPSGTSFSSEYIELYNPTADTLHVAGISIADNTTLGHSSQFDILPGGYIILTPSEEVGSFQKYGEVIPLSPWPSLNNSDENLFLINATGDTLQYLSYHSGLTLPGKSLEMTDASGCYNTTANWQPSVVSEGGTPGGLNSVNGVLEDHDAPFPKSAYISREGKLVLQFSEEVTSSIEPANLYLTSGQEVVQGISATSFNGTSAWTFSLSKSLKQGVPYRLTLTQIIADCSGNFSEQMVYEPVAIGEVPAEGEVVMNELLFNPPPGGVDFVEIYNNTNRYLDISHLFIGNKDDLVPASDMPITIGPGEYLALTADPNLLSSQYPAYDPGNFLYCNLPSFPDAEGMLTLKGPGEHNTFIIYEEYAYDEKHHNALVKNTEGVSLERTDPYSDASQAISWTSAASDAGYGTPGAPNSQAQNRLADEGEVTLSTQIITPNLDGVDDFVTIGYRFENGGNVVNVLVFDHTGRQVASIAKSHLSGSEGALRWEGIDDNGNLVATGYYMIVVEYFNASGNKGRIKRKIAVSNLNN